jgi:uncharacterized protein YprB with RNaseH-like and TPR domain
MDLSDRLKSLGVRLGGQNIQPPQPAIIGGKLQDAWPIEKVVIGNDHLTDFGSAFMTSKLFSSNYRHGIVGLDTFTKPNMLAAWGNSNKLAEMDRKQILFLDTETSGLAGGTGTYAFLVGLGFFEESGFQVIQYFMRSPGDEAALLSAIIDRMASFQAIVTFNGKSFDIPLLKTRCILNRLPLPFVQLDHIDLLHLARRLWRNRLSSRALGDLEREILGFIRNQDEVPGYLIPQYYFDYLASGDARPLSGVFYHNVIDIVSMSALFEYMSNIIEYPDNTRLHSLDMVAIARLYEDNDRLEEAIDLYENGLVAGLPEEVYFKTIERYARLRRKQGRYDLAADLWKKTAKLGNLTACKELSMVLEHNLKRPTDALIWAREGLRHLPSHQMPRYQEQQWRDDLQKRIERLEKKVTSE